MSFIICGLKPGRSKRYACPSCDFESDDIEQFAVSMCWDCMYDAGMEEAEDAAA